MTYKIELFFNEFNNGWTETFFDTQSTTFEQATTLSPAFLIACMGFRNVNCVLSSCRASLIGTPFQSFDRPINQAGVRPPSTGSRNPDLVQTSLYCQLVGAAVGGQIFKRPLFLRGLCDIDTIRDADTGASDIPASLQNAAVSYLVTITARPWAIQIRTPINGTTVVPYAISSARQSPLNPNWTELFVPAPGVAPNVATQIVIGRVSRRILPSINRVWQVQAVTAATNPNGNWVAIPYLYRFPSSPTYLTRGYYKNYVVATAPIGTLSHLVRLVKRDTGRPTILTRGRAPGVAYRL